MQEPKIDKIIRSRRKTIELRVLTDATLVIRAPLRSSAELIEQFVREKSKWIIKKQEFFRANPENLRSKEFRTGELFPFLGGYLSLEVVDSRRPRIWLDGNIKMSSACLSNPGAYMKRWYVLKAKEILMPRVRELADVNGFVYRSVQINSAVTRWGSCGPNNTLNFSWRLLAAPFNVIDSVIFHELVHTEIKNHSSRFYRRLASVMPEYKESEKWLKNNSGILIF